LTVYSGKDVARHIYLVIYHCWSEGECKLDLSAVFLLLDDRMNCRRKAAFLKHSLQGDAERKQFRRTGAQIKG
jgi:hypothetical protein